MFFLFLFAFLFVNLNQIKPTYAQITPGCSISGGGSVQAGNNISVTHGGFYGGDNFIVFGTAGNRIASQTTANSQSALVTQSVTVPADTPPAGGYYMIIRTAYPQVPYTCTGGTFTVTAAPPPPTPGCTYNPNSVAIGGTITISSINHLAGEIRIAGSSWPQPATGSVSLGNISDNGILSATIPTTSSPQITAGSYEVRGPFGVLCTTTGGGGTLIVTTGGGGGCTITPDNGAAGDTITISSSMVGTINVQPIGSGTVTAVGSTMGLPGPPYVATFQLPTTPPLATGVYKIGVATGIYAIFCNNLTVIAPGGGGPNNLRVAVNGMTATFTFDPSDGSFVVIADTNCPDFLSYPTRPYDSGQLAPGTATVTTPQLSAGVYCAKIVKAQSGETLSALQYFEILTDAVTGGSSCEGFVDCLTGIQTPTTAFSENGLIGAVFSSILPIIIGLGGFLAVIIIVISGIQFITSNGNPEAAAAARGRLIFAVVGFALLLLAFAITQIVDSVFLRGSGVV